MDGHILTTVSPRGLCATAHFMQVTGETGKQCKAALKYAVVNKAVMSTSCRSMSSSKATSNEQVAVRTFPSEGRATTDRKWPSLGVGARRVQVDLRVGRNIQVPA